MKRVVLMVAALALLLGGVGQAKAGYLTFSNRTTFLAAAGGGLALADFEAVSGNGYQTLSSGNAPSIPAGVTFSSTGGGGSDLFVAPANFNGNPAIATASLFANFFGTPLIASLSPTVTAVGADVIPFDFQGNTATIIVTLHDPNGSSSTFTVTPPAGSSQFFGVIGTAGTVIDQIRYAPPGGFTTGIDNFVFGQAATVPEPASLALLGTASMTLAGYCGWRRRKAVAIA